MSRVCCVLGLLCLGFVVSRVGPSRVCLSRVGYGAHLTLVATFTLLLKGKILYSVLQIRRT